jgi:hypothetical protein
VPPPHIDFALDAVAPKPPAPSQSAAQPFRPLLEVDEFILPSVCQELCRTDRILGKPMFSVSKWT